jgi:Zn-dependent peptidase ImmA (M78 family)
LPLTVEAYIARNPRYVVVSEHAFVYLPRFRFTITEEVCHRVLEYKLWETDSFPTGAKPHELTPKQLRDIESNAKYLAAEILAPAQDFKVQNSNHRVTLNEQHPGIDDERLIKRTIKSISGDFGISVQSAAYRAQTLRLISRERCNQYFPPLL